MSERIKMFWRALGITLIIFIMALAVVYVNIDAITAFAINHFTDYHISFKQWSGNPFGHSELKDIHFEIKGKGIAIRANKASMDIDAGESYRQKALLMDCHLEGAELVAATPGTGAATEGNLLDVIYSSGQKYDVAFSAQVERKKMTVNGFEASAKDIRIKGDCTLIYGRDEVDLDIKVSLSPLIAEKLPEYFRQQNPPDADGWYTSEVNFKGNIIILKALYMIAT